MTVTIRNLTRADAETRRSHISGSPSYAIALDLTGASAIRATSGDDETRISQQSTFGSTTTITADFTAPTGTWLEITGQVNSVTIDGRPMDINHDGHRLELPALHGQHEIVVEATCEYSTSGKGLTLVVDQTSNDVLCHTQGEEYGANLFFACFDQPDIKGTFDISVTVDSGWTCVSNEPQIAGPEGHEGGTHRFATTAPISTYLVAVVPGAYHRLDGGTHNGVDLGIYAGASLLDDLRNQADELFEVTRQGFDFFTEKFRRPYPYTKYDQLFVPGFRFGAMENPGCVTFTERYVFRGAVTEAERGSRANTVLHEMAHMWFGDEVTMRWWDDLWLNESFATATSYDAEVKATQFASARVEFATGMKSWAVIEDDRPTTHPIVVSVADIAEVHQNFDGITYAKGASVLLQLLFWVGEDAFYQGCATYFEEFAGGNTTLPDFLRHLAAASGRDLDGWAQAWLHTTGIGRVRLDTADDGAAITSATLSIVDGPDEPAPRPYRLLLGVYDEGVEGWSRRTQIDVDLEGPAIEIDQLVGLPATSLVVVNDDDHAYVKVAYDDRMLNILQAHLGDLESVMARSVLWRSLWEAVRDGELAARRYAAMVCQHAPKETDTSALRDLLSRASAARWRYGNPDNARQLEQEQTNVAAAALAAAEPGSGLQLIWFREWLATADAPADHLAMQAMLESDGLPEGIKLDPTIRWQIVSKLAARGVFDATHIEAELMEDPTDRGRTSALAARAGLPTLDAKEEAWERLTTDPALNVSQVRALAGAFGSFRQAELLAPWTTRYFDDLRTLWATRSHEDAILVAETAFPHPNPSAALVERVTDELQGNVPGQLQRSLREELDTLQRTLRARALDTDA